MIFFSPVTIMLLLDQKMTDDLSQKNRLTFFTADITYDVFNVNISSTSFALWFYQKNRYFLFFISRSFLPKRVLFTILVVGK